MKNFIVNAFIILVFLTGCSNDEAYNNAVQKGMDYIISEEYQKAESAFEFALDEKTNDEKATALLTQIISYQELIKTFDEGDFDLAVENADEVMQIENGSSALVKKSEEILEKIEVLKTILTTETEKYEKALGYFETNEYDEANEQLNEVLNEELEHPIFNSLNENVEKLNKDIESALLVEEKEREEREEKEKIAQEKEEQIRKENEAKESTNVKSEEELLAEVTAVIEKEFGYNIKEEPYVYYSEIVEDNLLSVEVRGKAGGPGAETLSIMGFFRYSGDTGELWIFDAAASYPDYYLHE